MVTFINERISYDSYRFIKAQTNAIDTSKYIESQKLKRDLFYGNDGKPSQEFYIWWINSHAEKFRNEWYTSCCRKCAKVISCKDCLKNECPAFILDPNWDFLTKNSSEEKGAV